jgi:predicted dehydrogenase
MDERRFRVGIIGLGGMGHNHALACRVEPDVDLVAGCDLVAERRAAWGRTFGVAAEHLYDDYNRMLDQERLDLVIVPTHAAHRREPVLAAAKRGVHVFCEKPLAPTLREGDEMVAACEAAGVKMAVNHIKRGSRGNAIARRLIREGAIGEVYLIRGEAKGGRWAASELMEMGTHLFDWLRLVVAEHDKYRWIGGPTRVMGLDFTKRLRGEPEWLFAHVVQNGRPAAAGDIVHSTELPYDDFASGHVLGERAFCSLGFASGLHADVGFLAQPDVRDVGYGFDVVGTSGTLALRRSVGTEIFLQVGHHRGPLGAGSWERVPVDELEGLSPPATSLDEAGERLACQRRMLRDLLDAIAFDREPVSSGRDGLIALELVMAVWQSHRERRPVALPMAQREHPLSRWLADEAEAKDRPVGARR